MIPHANDIVVLGANSQLGQTLRAIRPDWVYLDRSDVDLLKIQSSVGLFSRKPKVLINFAAYTFVDLAESEPDKAMQINGNAVGFLAGASEKFLHISTDYVFSGEKSSPYKETDETKPRTIYGKSKLLGEQLATQYNANSIIIRTSWLYSQFGVNFVKRMLDLSETKKQMNIVSDQMGTPTAALDLVAAIVKIVEGDIWCPGIYHYSNTGQCTWYDFAKYIFTLRNKNTEVLPIRTEDYPTPAQRPKYSVLDKTKIIETFNVSVPDWQKSLLHFLQVGDNEV